MMICQGQQNKSYDGLNNPIYPGLLTGYSFIQQILLSDSYMSGTIPGVGDTGSLCEQDRQSHCPH